MLQVRCASIGIGAKGAYPEVSRVRVLREPLLGADETLGEHAKSEAQVRCA